jgi:phosphatidylglycerol:prolipoprotein diacylglycerol transferase
MLTIDIDPNLWQWGDWKVGWHGVFLALGLLTGYAALLWRMRGRGVAVEKLNGLFIAVALSGYTGARLLHVALNWPAFAGQPGRILAIQDGGMTLYGGVVAGALAVVIYARLLRLPLWTLGDAAAVAVAAGEIVGRCGCLINGDVWGLPTGGDWGLVYTHPNALVPVGLHGVALFPAPIAYQAWALVTLALLFRIRRRTPRPGALFLAFLLAYAAGRALISAWMPVERLWGITTTQFTSLGVAGLVLALAAWRRRQVRAGAIT